jgi:C4-dicarboxylate-specific signal transduction histidine kinase
LESLPALICLLTPDRRVAFANRGFRERFGAPQDRHCYECCFGKNEPCEFCETYDVLKTGRPHRWEVVSPDGRGVIDVYDFPFTDADGSPMILEMGIDITERRQAEADARRMRDELARVDRVARMGELTASLAHEINQPLAAILSNAQAARRFLASGPPDLNEIRDILDDIIQDDKRAGSVVHRLRLMLQKGKHEAETFDVNNVVREVVQFLHSEILGRNAALSTDLAPDLPAVHAGRVEVQQVMVNLLLNALDALKDVPGESRSILVRTSMEEDAVVVAVRDRGCGIHAQDLGGVFEPFFTTKPAGLGMGLAICRRIVQAYGGRIWAARNEDTGATVSFSLPCAQARQEPNDG